MDSGASNPAGGLPLRPDSSASGGIWSLQDQAEGDSRFWGWLRDSYASRGGAVLNPIITVPFKEERSNETNLPVSTV